MKAIFKSSSGEVLTTYDDISGFTCEELIATKELLEYERGVKVNWNIEN